jgi:hypothetical protein
MENSEFIYGYYFDDAQYSIVIILNVSQITY